MKLIYKGAEAELYKTDYMDMPSVLKKRTPKTYRIKEIDEKLSRERIKTECTMLREVRRAVLTPRIFDINMPQKAFTMEFIDGTKVRDLFYQGKMIKELGTKIGENVSRLHNADFVHGDLTTSNMIYKNGKLYFIDFGLSSRSKKDEDKAVDLKALRDMLKSTHYKHFDAIWNAFQKGYKNQLVLKKVKDVEKRARYFER